MKRLIVSVAAVALALPAAGTASADTTTSLSISGSISLAPDFAYVAGGNGSVSLAAAIKMTAGGGTQAATIAVGHLPNAITITPDGKIAYVVNYGADTVTPILTATNRVGKSIRVRGGPQEAAVTPDGKTLYVTSFSHVTPIATATDIPGKPIRAGNSSSDLTSIAITPDGTTAYVGDHNRGVVIPINIATNTAGKPIRVGSAPDHIAITPDGRTAYVVDTYSDAVTPIDTATNTAGKPIYVPADPDAIAITPDGSTAYVVSDPGNSEGMVTPINTATNTREKKIRVGYVPIAIAITPNGKTAYVVDSPGGGTGSVVPIHIATNAVRAAIGLGSTDPTGIAISPDGSTAYVSQGLSTAVRPILTATNQAQPAISVGLYASAIAIPNRVGLVFGGWPGTAGPLEAKTYYGYPYPYASACTDGGTCRPDQWHFFRGQCTSWVAYRINELSNVPFNNYYDGSRTNLWGPAANWGPHAQSLASDGVTVSTTPTQGSIAWYSYGHVAYVEWVNSPTSVVVSEMNYDNDNGFLVRTITTSKGWPTAFIHIPGA